MADGKLEIEIVRAGSPGPSSGAGGPGPASGAGSPGPSGGGGGGAGAPGGPGPASGAGKPPKKTPEEKDDALASGLMGGGIANLITTIIEGAAGPVGIALAAHQAANQASQQATEAIQGMGKAAAGIARLNTGVIADGMESLAGKVPVLGDAFVAGSQAIRSVIDGVEQTAQRLSSYNGVLARSQAMAEVAQIQGDIRRAQMLGPDLAVFTAMKSEASQNFENAMAILLKELMPVVNTIVGTLLVISRGAETGTEALLILKDIALLFAPGASKDDLLAVAKRIEDLLKRKEEVDDVTMQALMQFVTGGGFAGGERPGVVDDARNGPPRALRVEARPFQI